MNHTMRVFFQYAKLYIILLLCAVVLLTAVFLIPDNLVAEHREISRNIIIGPDGEGAAPWGYFGNEAAAIDNLTDEIMLLLTRNTDRDAFSAALYSGSYARYWQGYLVFLRPALVFLNYRQIRYVNMFLFYGLVCLVFSLMHRRFGLPAALAFIGALTGIYIFVIPVCLQYFTVFMILLVFSVVILTRYESIGRDQMRLLFFAAGCVTSFLDFLTAPLLTLGIPLALYLCCEIDADSNRNVTAHLKSLVIFSVIWGLGYGIFWASKWLLSTVFLDINVLKDAGEQAVFRIAGNAEHPNNIAGTLDRNLEMMFLSQGKTLAIAVLGQLIGLIVISVVFRKEKTERFRQMPLLALTIYPYLWYAVMQNHSFVHYYFTYRNQMMTVFALLLFLVRCTDWGKLSSWLGSIFCRSGKDSARKIDTP